MTDKIEVKKAPAATAPEKKPAARKAPARKAPAKKIAAKKTAPAKTVFETFEELPPVKLANKTFMASLGVFAFVQKEIDKRVVEFDKKFSQYAKDGEKLFDHWEDKAEGFRKDVEKRVDDVRDRVRDTFKKAA
jgi:hypothetical protein